MIRRILALLLLSLSGAIGLLWYQSQARFLAYTLVDRDRLTVGVLAYNGVAAIGWSDPTEHAEHTGHPDLSAPPKPLPVFSVKRGNVLLGPSSVTVLTRLWLPLIVLGAYPAWRGALFVKRGLGRRTGHCKCGYDLTGNESGVCPECGVALGIGPSAGRCGR